MAALAECVSHPVISIPSTETMRKPVKAKTIAVVAFAVASAFAAAPSLGSESDHKPTSQQSRFATCAHESKGLKGEEHHHFMSDCLKGHSEGAHKKEQGHATAGEGGQHNRMKSCNEAAGRKDLHGDERRAFMSSCLKG
jgi:psiF repeat-containing protein